MLYYILQTIAFQLFFLLIYDVFLKKETFFNWNRAYLLITALGSLLLPFVKIEFFKGVVPEQFIIRLPEVIIGDVTSTTKNISLTEIPLNESSFVWHWEYLVYVGMILAALLFAYKMIKISLLIYKNPKRWKDNVLLVNLINSTSAFSFFHYICIVQLIKEEDKSAILKHEIVHVQQKHSLDLLFFEILRILFWFNPLVYMYQNKISTLHEFIADANAIKHNDKNQYYENLLSQVFDVKQFSFINPFYKQSLIKKRIVMLNKSKSKQVKLVKYALLIPIVFGMLMYTSSNAQEKTTQENSINQELSYQELVDKYYKMIQDHNKNGKDFEEIYSIVNINRDKYIWSKDELARLSAFWREMADGVIKMKSEKGTLTVDDQERLENIASKYKTYENYLDYKKTDEAKEVWENQARDGVVRLVVDDMKNMTEAEKKRQQEKIDLILKDDYYHTLITTSVNGGGSTMSFDKPKDLVETKEVITYDIEVPFAVIDEVPTFDECKQLATNIEKKDCMSSAIANHVSKNFNTKLAKELNLKGKQRISVVFVIANDGTIKSAKARAPHPALEAEAIRVVESLPKMTPGKYNGKNVNVPYSLPIIFQVQ